MIRSSLCDYSDAYILVKGTMSIKWVAAAVAAAAVHNNDQEVVFKNCASFTDCITIHK